MKKLLKKNQLMITALAIMLAVAGYLQFAGDKLDQEGYLPTSGDVADGEIGENLISEDVGGDYDLSDLLDLSEDDLLAGADGMLEDIGSLETDIDSIADAAGAGELTDANPQMADGSVVDGNATDGTLGATPQEGEIPGDAVFTSGLGVSATLSDAKLLKEQTRAKNKETLLSIINSAGLTDVQKQSAVDAMVEMTRIAEKEMAAEILLEAKGFSDVVVSIDGDSVDVVVNALSLDDTQRAQIEDIVKRKAEVDAANIIISTVVQ